MLPGLVAAGPAGPLSRRGVGVSVGFGMQGHGRRHFVTPTSARRRNQDSDNDNTPDSNATDNPNDNNAVELKHDAKPEPAEEVFVSKAIRDTATAKATNLRISPRKLNDICRLVRGLSCEEAMIQMRMNPKPKARWVENLIRAAVNNAVNNFNMEAERLYIAELVVGKGSYRKKLRYHSKGRFGLAAVYYSHMWITVKEQAYEEGELRIGRRGRKIATVRRTKKQHDEIYEKYASVLRDFED